MFNKLLQGALGAGVTLGLMALGGCGTNASSAATTDAKKKVAVTSSSNSAGTNSTTTTTTTATVTQPVLSPNGISGEKDIADNFDTASWLEPGVTEPASPDLVGAFRFTCLAGQLAKDDPLVYPGQAGASHLHQFFGNDGTNSNSTYQSLRTSGGSTCTRSTGTSPQRSAYWMPAMLDGAGNAIKANFMNTYYKQLPASNSACGAAPDATHIGYCVGMPNGLRFITGYNMTTGKGGPNDANSMDYWKMGFDCVNPADNTTYLTSFKQTIADVVATGMCPTGAWLRVFVTFPDCWDGVHLDTADHRSHVVYADGAGMQGRRACPADHPYNIPEIAIQAYFTTDANFEAGKWHISSDEVVAGTTAGATLHMDYWEAWSSSVKDLWQTNCINAHLTCSTGNLGNGQEIKGMQQLGSYPSHVLVPLTSI